MCEARYLILELYIYTEIHIRKMVNVAPPIVPNIIGRWFCPWFFFLGIIISCGSTIGGLDDASSHVVVEKVRHKFPDVLQKIKILICTF